MDTKPITLPCSLAHTGNNYKSNLSRGRFNYAEVLKNTFDIEILVLHLEL